MDLVRLAYPPLQIARLSKVLKGKGRVQLRSYVDDIDGDVQSVQNVFKFVFPTPNFLRVSASETRNLRQLHNRLVRISSSTCLIRPPRTAGEAP